MTAKEILKLAEVFHHQAAGNKVVRDGACVLQTIEQFNENQPKEKRFYINWEWDL